MDLTANQPVHVIRLIEEKRGVERVMANYESDIDFSLVAVNMITLLYSARAHTLFWLTVIFT